MTKAKTSVPPTDPNTQPPIPPVADGQSTPPASNPDLQDQVNSLLKTVSQLQHLLATSMSNTDALQKAIKEQNEKMVFMAGRVKNDEWDNKKKAGKGARIVRLRKHNGKIVIGWSKMTENWANNKNASKVWQESLRTKLFLEDGTEEEVDYAAFSVSCEFEDAEVKKTSVIDSPIEGVSPDVTFTLETKDGKELVLNSRFVN